MSEDNVVNLVISIATILVAVIGAHNLARHQDKTKATAELFSRIFLDIRNYQDSFNEFILSHVNQPTYWKRRLDPGERADIRTEERAQIHAALIKFGEMSSIGITNEFLLTMIVGSDTKKINDAMKSIYRYAQKEVEAWSKSHLHDPKEAETSINGFNALMLELAEKMKSHYQTTASIIDP